MRHLLFICSRNRLRSPTAETVFSEYQGVKTDSAGVRKDADVPVSEEQVAWADTILVMENVHRKILNEQFKQLLKDKKIVVLSIPDNYQYMQPELIELLKKRCSSHLPVS